jgi:RNA polymerase sigma-70 factor (ECF subfamily)
MRPFADLHAIARRASRRQDEAEDLVQTALLAALEAGRADFSDAANRRWIAGVIRNRAAFEGRTSARRRRRERRWAAEAAPPSLGETDAAAIDRLSPSLRMTALLALSGHTRKEIGWLLGLSDVALRQRISLLKRTLARTGGDMETQLSGQLAFGRIRRALMGAAHRGEAFLASHDPDGHLFVVSRPHFAAAATRSDTGDVS